MAEYHPAPTASVALILRTSNIPLPYGATISTVPLSAGQLDNNFISNQNIFIPQPQIYISGGDLASSHKQNSQIINKTNKESLIQNFNKGISLYWSGSDKTFLDHDPHFFLFRHTNKGMHHARKHKHKRQGEKKHSMFVHPSHKDKAMFNNFSAGDQNWGNTEWPIWSTHSGNLVNLNLNSHDYYRINDSASGYLINNYFPRTLESWNNEVYIRGNKGKKLKIKAKKVVLSFAIVIRDPKNPLRYIIGPMSKTLIITPKLSKFLIPSEYVNMEDNTLNIPELPIWEVKEGKITSIFYGWKAYTK
jgi:hypothetical protein